MALVLSRYAGQSIVIRDNTKQENNTIIIKPYELDNGLIRIYIDAPKEYSIERNELTEGKDADG